MSESVEQMHERLCSVIAVRDLKCFPNRMLGNRSANHLGFLPMRLPWSETARPGTR